MPRIVIRTLNTLGLYATVKKGMLFNTKQAKCTLCIKMHYALGGVRFFWKLLACFCEWMSRSTRMTHSGLFAGERAHEGRGRSSVTLHIHACVCGQMAPKILIKLFCTSA